MYIPSSTSNIATTKNITVIPVGISDVGTISTGRLHFSMITYLSSERKYFLQFDNILSLN